MKKSAKRASMKAKTVSKIAKGVMAKSSVFSGRKLKTVGGLQRSDLVKNKNGKIVSKKMSARAKRSWASGKLKAWADAVKRARKALGVKGFVAIGVKPPAGKALYAKAKALD